MLLCNHPTTWVRAWPWISMLAEWQAMTSWNAKRSFSAYCDAQPSLVKSCSDYSELSSPDVMCGGVLGAAYPPMSSRSVLLSSWRFTLEPGFCWSLPFLPFSKEAVRWTQRPCVGVKGDWLSKQICQLAEVGMAGTECPYQGVPVAVCRTELTFFVLLLTHSLRDLHWIGVPEHLVLLLFSWCAFKGQGPFWYQHWEHVLETLPQPTSHKFLRSIWTGCASDLLKARKQPGVGFSSQNYCSTAFFSLKPVQVQKGNAYHQKETDFSHVQMERIQAGKNLDCDQPWYLVLQNWSLSFPGPGFVHLYL